MSGFKIITDTTADLPADYIREHRLGCMFLPYHIDGEGYREGHELEEKEFYNKMRAGLMPTTSQVNPAEAKRYFEGYLEESGELLYLAFSSGLSGTCNSGRIAAKEVMEEHKGCKITVIDTKCASLGEGLMVHKAVKMRQEGRTMDETAAWVQEHLLNMVHVFTVDDLNHLYRGGRVSRATALIGTMAGIKPVLHVDNEGHLVPVGKTRGRKKSLHKLVEYMGEHMGGYADKNDIVFISHGDAPEDAELVRREIEERYGIKNFLVNTIGPTVGAHAGPGTIALFFMGDAR